MNGLFQRIARRHADRPDDAAGSAAPDDPIAPDGATTSGTDATPDAPTQRLDVVDAAAAEPSAGDGVAAPADPPATTVESPTPADTPAGSGEPTPPAGSPATPVAAPAADVPAADPAPGSPTAQPLAAGQQPTDAAAATGEQAAEAAQTAETPAAEQERRPGFRERGRMRRRLRYLRKLRELQVRDLGGLVFDLRRFERKRDDLVAQKIDQIRACDEELRALEQALEERRDVRDVREPGIGGTCPRCFALYGSADRFCANCGAALGGAAQGPALVPVLPAAAPPDAGGPR